MHLGRGDQFQADFLRLAPNNRMPAIVDTDPIGGGAPLGIFETGAIMMYLAEKPGRFWPQEPHKIRGRPVVYWQTGNQGPKMGEQGHFPRADAGTQERRPASYSLLVVASHQHYLAAASNRF